MDIQGAAAVEAYTWMWPWGPLWESLEFKLCFSQFLSALTCPPPTPLNSLSFFSVDRDANQLCWAFFSHGTQSIFNRKKCFFLILSLDVWPSFHRSCISFGVFIHLGKLVFLFLFLSSKFPLWLVISKVSLYVLDVVQSVFVDSVSFWQKETTFLREGPDGNKRWLSKSLFWSHGSLKCLYLQSSRLLFIVVLE